MPLKPRYALISLAQFAALISFATAAAGKPAEKVDLAYAWPAGLKVESRFTHKATRTQAGKQSMREMSGRYGFRTVGVDNSLRIDYQDFQTEVTADGKAAGIAAEMQALMTGIAQSVPSILIKPDGEFGGVVDLAAFQRALTERIQAWLATSPSLTALQSTEQQAARQQAEQAVGQMMNTLLSKEALEQRMAEDWNLMVGAWIGGALEKGAVYRAETSYTIAALGNVSAPYTLEFKYLGSAPCHKADKRKRCAELEMRSQVSSEAVAKAIEETTNRNFAGTPAQVSVSNFAMEQTSRLLTEPKTLLPHRVQTSKTTMVTFADGANKTTTTQVDESSQSFTYPARKAP